MSRLTAFGRFWWDFIIGDDWLAAAGIALAIGATAAVAAAGIAAWWLLRRNGALALPLAAASGRTLMPRIAVTGAQVQA